MKKSEQNGLNGTKMQFGPLIRRTKLARRIRKFVRKMRILDLIAMKYEECVMQIGDVYICCNCSILYDTEVEAVEHIAKSHTFRDSPFRGGD